MRLVDGVMPAFVRNWRHEGWGFEVLDAALLAGPLNYERHTGSVEGIEVIVEVWPIPAQEGLSAISASCRSRPQRLRRPPPAGTWSARSWSTTGS